MANSAKNGGVVDWGETISAVNGDQGALTGLVEAALVELPGLAKRLRAAMAAGNANALRLAAHTLKGSLHYFGEGPAYAQVRQLEEMGRNGMLGGAEAALEEVESELGRIIAELEAYTRNPQGAALWATKP